MPASTILRIVGRTLETTLVNLLVAFGATALIFDVADQVGLSVVRDKWSALMVLNVVLGGLSAFSGKLITGAPGQEPGPTASEVVVNGFSVVAPLAVHACAFSWDAVEIESSAFGALLARCNQLPDRKSLYEMIVWSVFTFSLVATCSIAWVSAKGAGIRSKALVWAYWVSIGLLFANIFFLQPWLPAGTFSTDSVCADLWGLAIASGGAMLLLGVGAWRCRRLGACVASAVGESGGARWIAALAAVICGFVLAALIIQLPTWLPDWLEALKAWLCSLLSCGCSAPCPPTCDPATCQPAVCEPDVCASRTPCEC